MSYAARLAHDIRTTAAAASLIPLALAASAAGLPYAPLWALCHWLTRADQGHQDAPALLVWLTWHGLIPARLLLRLKDALNRALANPRTAAATIGGGTVSGAAMITTYFLIFTGHIGPGGTPSVALSMTLLLGGMAAYFSTIYFFVRIPAESLSQD